MRASSGEEAYSVQCTLRKLHYRPNNPRLQTDASAPGSQYNSHLGCQQRARHVPPAVPNQPRAAGYIIVEPLSVDWED